MKEYIKIAGIGILIGAVVVLLFSYIFAPLFFSVLIIQSALQGILSKFIYTQRKLPYLFKMLIQMIGSWGLSLTCFLTIPESFKHPNLFIYSLLWFLIWIIIFIYVYIKNRTEAKRINHYLKEKKQ